MLVQGESKFAALFNQLALQQQDQGSSRDVPKSRYAFWQTQPVPQFGAEQQVTLLILGILSCGCFFLDGCRWRLLWRGMRRLTSRHANLISRQHGG